MFVYEYCKFEVGQLITIKFSAKFQKLFSNSVSCAKCNYSSRNDILSHLETCSRLIKQILTMFYLKINYLKSGYRDNPMVDNTFNMEII